MTSDQSAGKWLTGWLRPPFTQSVLLSSALHLALLLTFQPASGPGGQQIVVIEARLQSMQTDKDASLAKIDSVAWPEPAVEPDWANSPPEATSLSSAAWLTAMSASPAQPVPLSTEPEQEPAEVRPDPLATSAPPVEAASRSVTDTADPEAASMTAATQAGVPHVGGLPSLPIAIDDTWYLARQVDVHPKAIGVIEPVYPEAAKRQNLEGTLKLMLKIDQLGRVTSAEVVESVPAEVFDAAALAAFRDARFSPAIRDGRPVRYQAYIRVEFKLTD